MPKSLSLAILILSFTVSCSTKQSSISFYHWKAKAISTELIKENLNKNHTKKIFMHFFDVEKSTNHYWDEHNNIYPKYVLKDVSKDFKEYDIIPVVYIVNSVFKEKNIKIEVLVKDISSLIEQINETHFKKEFKEIQIDCDWTESTKNTYFEFLKEISTKYSINATIRLHQVKYQKRTGIPPVKKGTLMLYNIGDLKNKNQNSILDNSIVKQYINKESSYPLVLDLALPIFSQTVVFNKNSKIKIIKNTNRKTLEKDFHFKKIDKNNFIVTKDTLYKGFYLTKEYNLKLEEIKLDEIISSVKTIKNSKLNLQETIIYHLDNTCLKNIEINKISETL